MNQAVPLRQKKRLIVAVAGVLLLAVLYLWHSDVFARARPKDSELVTLFREHREAFEKLRVMALEDAGRVTYLSETTLDRSSLSRARRDQYKQLLDQIRRDLVVRIDPREVSFSYSDGGVGLAIGHSWMKGIAYLPNGAERVGIVVKSLDEIKKRDGVYLVPIEGNWYLTYVELD